jgi:hypothetical protein
MTGISRRVTILKLSLFALLLIGQAQLFSQSGIAPAPNRTAKDGRGPYDRLVIRGITVIDGTGAAPEGPMDVVAEHDRIVDVVSVGLPYVPIKEKGRSAKGTREIDGTGMYLMPGFVDTHVHYGDTKKAPDAEYVNKRWLAIKDGIVFDNKQLLADVAAMVAKQKEAIKGPVTLQGVPRTYETK